MLWSSTKLAQHPSSNTFIVTMRMIRTICILNTRPPSPVGSRTPMSQRLGTMWFRVGRSANSSYSSWKWERYGSCPCLSILGCIGMGPASISPYKYECSALPPVWLNFCRQTKSRMIPRMIMTRSILRKWIPSSVDCLTPMNLNGNDKDKQTQSEW